MKEKVSQSRPTLCDLVDYTAHGILQAKVLEWVAFSFSRGSSQPRDQNQVSHIASGFFTSWSGRVGVMMVGGKVMQISTEGRQRNATLVQEPHVLQFGVGVASKQ